jgi:hypothetical protein
MADLVRARELAAQIEPGLQSCQLDQAAQGING